MKREIKTNIPLVFLLVGLALLMGSVISFCVGKYPISLGEIRDLAIRNLHDLLQRIRKITQAAAQHQANRRPQGNLCLQVFRRSGDFFLQCHTDAS